MVKHSKPIRRIARLAVTGLVLMVMLVTACAPAATPTLAPTAAPPPNPPTAAPAPTKPPVVPTLGPTQTPLVIMITPTPVPARSTLVIALARAPVSLDPADHRSRESETVIRNMYDGLVTRDSTSGVHPEIAESYKWLDAKTLEIKLRKDVKFHDGSTMTADDVVFTYERVIKDNAIEYPQSHTSPRKGLIAPLVSVAKKDDATVVMTFSAAWPVAPQMLVHQQIVSKAYVTKVGTKGLVEAPMGTGPFKFVSAKTGLEEIVLERFDGYYGGAPDLTPVGKACVTRVIFRVIPETSTRVAALLAGEVDIATEVPPELMSMLKQVPGIQVKAVAGTRPLWMELNVRQAPFDNVKVRQALNFAVDKDLITLKIYNNLAQPLAGPLMPTNNYANPALKPYAYDKTKALALLKEAGWLPGADKMLAKDGKPFTFVIDTQDSTRSLAEALASQFRDIGIDASVRIWEYSVVLPKLLAGERQAYVGDWGDSAFDPVGHMEAKWSGYKAGSTYGRGNFSGYANARVDALIISGETENDVAKRHTIYDEAQKLIYDEAPAVFLVLPQAIEAASSRVQNWQPASDSRENMHDVCLK